MAFESLTIDINARLAKFESELRKVGTSVERSAKQSERAYQQSLDRLEGHAKRIGAALGGVFSIGLFARLIAGVAEAQDKMGELAETVGVPVEQLSALKFAAEQNGVALEGLADGLKKLNKGIAETQGGTGEAREGFRALRIEVELSKGVLKSSETILLEIADKFADMEDGAGKTALAMRLFGRSGADLIPFLNKGRSGIAALTAEAKQLGVVMSGESIRAASEFSDNLDRIKAVAQGLSTELVNRLLPSLSTLSEEFLDGIRIAGGFWRALRLGLDINPFEAPIENIKTLTEEINKLKAAADAPGAGLAQVLDARDRVPQLERAREFAIAQENRRLRDQARTLGISDEDPFGGAPGRGRGKAQIIADSSAAKQAADALAKLAEAGVKRVLEVEQRFATLRLKTLEGFYGQGLIAEDEYWDTRLAIQQEALTKELAAADQEIAAIRRRKPSATGDADQISALRELEDALARRNKLEQEFGAFAVENSLQAARAARDYADAVADLDARMAELEGRSADALAIRQQQQSRALRARLEANRDTAGLARLDTFERAGRGQATMNDLRARGAEITDRLAIAEERIQNSQRTGAISEIESLRRTGEARQRSVAELGEIANALDRAAASSGNERLRIQAEQFRVEMERLAAQSDLLRDKFDQIGETSFSTFLEEAVYDIENIDKAFSRMTDNIAREITRLASQDIAKKIFGGASDSGFGFGSILAKIFGSGGGGSIVDAFSAGNFATGGSFIVGGSGGIDQTPVMFRATAGERVTVTPPGQAAGGGVRVVNQFTISGPVDQRTQQQISAAAGQGVARAMRRNT